MEKILLFCLIVGAIAFVLGQGNNRYYYPNGQVGYVNGYPLGDYLRARNVYLRARLADRRQDSFLGDIVGLGGYILLFALYKNYTRQLIG